MLVERIFQERIARNTWSFYSSKDKKISSFFMCFCKMQDAFEQGDNKSLSYVHRGKGSEEQIAAMHSANENLALK